MSFRATLRTILAGGRAVVLAVIVSAFTPAPARAIEGGVATFDQTVVSIFNYSRSTSQVTFSCTGVLIARDLVLTAAHCALKGPQFQTPLDDDDMRFVYFGRETHDDAILSLFTSPSLSFSGPSLVRYSLPAMVRVNPDYRGIDADGSLYSGVQHDVALMKLNEAVPVQPARFFTGSVRKGVSTTVFGFGPTNENDVRHRLVMRALKTSITSFDKSTMQFEIASSHTSGLIHGDSGGPAFVSGRIWGINSSSMKGAYSHVEPVAPVVPWILRAATALGVKVAR